MQEKSKKFCLFLEILVKKEESRSKIFNRTGRCDSGLKKMERLALHRFISKMCILPADWAQPRRSAFQSVMIPVWVSISNS